MNFGCLEAYLPRGIPYEFSYIMNDEPSKLFDVRFPKFYCICTEHSMHMWIASSKYFISLVTRRFLIFSSKMTAIEWKRLSI